MHHISWLRLQNFRSCKDIEFDLWRYTPLVGHNNVGKSNVIRGLIWLLNKSGLGEKDFFDTNSPVVATGRIEGITEDILDKLEAKNRKKIEDYVDNGTLWIRQKQELTTTPASQITVSLLTPGSDPTDADSWKNPAGIPAAMKALFPEPIHIEAMVDAVEDSGKFKAGTTIGKLLGAIQGAVQAARETELKKAVDELKDILSADGAARPQELTDIDEAATRILQGYFPDLKLRTHIPAPSLEVMFKSGTIQVEDQALPGWRGIDSLGHGALRSVQMSLVQCLAERNRDGGGSSTCTLLLVDEPELYLHPQAIEQARESLKRLSKANYQVVFSTHSPMFVEAEDVPNTHVVFKGDDGGTKCRTSFEKAYYAQACKDGPTQTEILFSLDHASKILFCERALIAEGPTEKRLLPPLYRLHHGRGMGGDRLALVIVEGKDSIPKTRAILRAMGIEAKILVDLDAAFNGESFCSPDNPDRQACEAVLARLNKNSNANGCKAMCQDPMVEKNIKALHDSLKADGIWIWPGGTIEDHLGLDGKKPRNHSAFKAQLDAAGMAAVADQTTVKTFLDWAAS